MYTQRYPQSAPPYPLPAGGQDIRRRPLPPCPYRSAPVSPAISVIDTTFDDRTPASFHEILDSTTLAVGFDQSCLEGLTADLLYTPTNAFAQSCWDILFPEQDPELELKTPISGPPSYRTLPQIYIHPGGSTSHSTIQPQSPEKRKREEDSYSFIDTASSAFWDSDDDVEDDKYEVETQDVKSFVSFDDDDESEVSSFSHIDAIKNHPIIDTDFSVKDDLFLNDPSKVDWRPSLMCWEDSLPISVVFREMPVSNKPPKMSKMAALRAKINILPFRSAAQV